MRQWKTVKHWEPGEEEESVDKKTRQDSMETEICKHTSILRREHIWVPEGHLIRKEERNCIKGEDFLSSHCSEENGKNCQELPTGKCPVSTKNHPSRVGSKMSRPATFSSNVSVDFTLFWQESVSLSFCYVVIYTDLFPASIWLSTTACLHMFCHKVQFCLVVLFSASSCSVLESSLKKGWVLFMLLSVGCKIWQSSDFWA